MSLLLDNRLGTEDLQLSIFKTVRTYIASYITAEETRGQAIDAELSSLPVTLEQFAAIHYGHRPSMIEAPVSEYPSMSVMVYSATPAASNMNADYGSSLSLRCAIEFIVKSGPYDEDDREGIGEDVVGRRAKRTTEALHRLLQDHAALDGKFMPPEIPPTIVFGEIFEREEDGETVTGSRWYWHGVRMEYTYLKMSVFGND